MTYEPKGSSAFYKKLLNWDCKDMPMEHTPDKKYYMFNEPGGKHFCGMVRPHEGGPLPAWIPYVSVKSAKETAAKAGKAGAKVMIPVSDVGAGVLAMFEDPQSAIFAIWESKKEEDSNYKAEQFCWDVLATSDTDAAWEFYSKVFPNWELVGDLKLLRMKGTKEPWGGIIKEDSPPAWCVHMKVSNVDATVKKAKSLGAKVVVEPCDVPDIPMLPTGRLSVISDPYGAVFGMLDLKKTAKTDGGCCAEAKSGESQKKR